VSEPFGRKWGPPKSRFGGQGATPRPDSEKAECTLSTIFINDDDDDDDDAMCQFTSEKWTLTVPRVVAHHDDGNYTCVVSNVYGQLRHSVYVEIVGTPSRARKNLL